MTASDARAQRQHQHIDPNRRAPARGSPDLNSAMPISITPTVRTSSPKMALAMNSVHVVMFS
jgi:hypothetical protein